MNLTFSGGGSKKTHTEDDNLRNDDNAELVLGLCEGPIEGLENGKRSFFINDTPLLASDGQENFTDYTLQLTQGDESKDEKIKFTLGGIGKGTVVGLELKEQGSSLTRQTSSANIDYIDVRIGIGALYSSDKKGNVNNATGKFRIEYRKSDWEEGRWVTYGFNDLYINGKTTSTYVKDYRIPVVRDDKEGVVYEIKVTRVSQASSTGSYGYFFTLYFSQYEEVDANDREFKNTAIAHLTIKTSEQVSSLPDIYGIYKLLKIKVPSNYNPETHTYNGLWDGTFKIAWTNNPAWCLYDLIVNDRYGVNAYYPVTPDKWDFYEAGKYCDEMVDNGSGGLEPRYTFNYLITESQSGPEMLNYIAASFNALIYEDAMGLVRLTYEDAEKPAVQIFNPTNVTPDGFTYTFSEPSARYNDYTVTYVDPNLNWEENRRRVTTPYGKEDIEELGRIPYDFNAIGCIKESEAIRKARYRLITSLKETMTVSFSTNRAAMNVNLFDTILVADPTMNYSQTGRIKGISPDRSTVYLRDDVFIEPGVAYEFNIQTSYNLFRCAVENTEFGRVKELRLDNVLPANIFEKAVFTLSGTDGTYGNPKPFKVISISENQGNPDQISISAVEIHRLKQQEADTGIELEDNDSDTRPDYSIIPHIKDANFKEFFNLNRLQNSLMIGIELDWDHYKYYDGSFIVYSRLQGDESGEWIQRKVEDGNIIYGHPAGDYEFKILPGTTLGLYPSLDTAPIFDFKVSKVASEAPRKVQNFQATGNIENIHLTWDSLEEASYYEIREGNDWATADLIATGLTELEYYYTKIEDENTHQFLIKAFNVAGQESEYPSVAYGALNPPKNVKKLYVTPNLDSLRFDWVAEPENYVSYEVRTGAGWESGITLFTVSGDNNTVLNPGFSSDAKFFIKAISRKGIYSEKALYAQIKQNLKQNRNVLLEIDNALGKVNKFKNSPEYYPEELTPWFGTTHGLTKDGPQGTMAMLDGYSNAEHFFPIHLPRVTKDGEKQDTIARNWYEAEFLRHGERLTWEDLQWAWDSEQGKSTTWLNSEDASNYGGKIEKLITIAKPDSEYLEKLGLRFNNTLKDVKGEVEPNESANITFADAKYDKGLVLNKLMKLKYDINLKETFSIRFKVFVDAATPDFIKIVRLTDSFSNYLDVYLDGGKIHIKRSDGIQAECEFSYKKYLDYISVMITQSNVDLTLDYSAEYANIKDSVRVDCEPLTLFTKLYFGAQYD